MSSGDCLRNLIKFKRYLLKLNHILEWWKQTRSFAKYWINEPARIGTLIQHHLKCDHLLKGYLSKNSKLRRSMIDPNWSLMVKETAEFCVTKLFKRIVETLWISLIKTESSIIIHKPWCQLCWLRTSLWTIIQFKSICRVMPVRSP